MFGGQVGVAGHLTIGNNIKVQAQTGIGHRVKDGEKLYGSPAIDYGNYVKSYVHFKNLPKIVNQLNKLEKKINNNE
jgi:UDP-3-O-[3-hydroxymyristoyl] glucosamine N-acyltransferase